MQGVDNKLTILYLLNKGERELLLKNKRKQHNITQQEAIEMKGTLRILAIAGIVMLLLSGMAIAEKTERQKVVDEAFYALDKDSVDSSWPNKNEEGNWNYLSSNYNAYNKIKSYYNCYSSIWNSTDKSGCIGNKKRPKSFYIDLASYGFYDSKGRGGQCKYFANLVTYRAIGQTDTSGLITFRHYGRMIDTPDDLRMIGTVRQGDVVFNISARTPIYNSEGRFLYYKYKPYTVLSVKSGNSIYGTVTSVEARDRYGTKKTISGDELQKHNISKYARGIEFAQPGDIIFDTVQAGGIRHTAIVAEINIGDSNAGTVTSLDVIDSNFVGDEVIGHHCFSGNKLLPYYVYTGVGYYEEIWEPYEPVLFRYINYEDLSDPYIDRIYEIGEDKDINWYKHWIIHEEAFKDQWYYGIAEITDVFINPSKSLWKEMIFGENIVFKDGTLIRKGDDTIYEIQNGEKCEFISQEAFTSKGYTLEMTVLVLDEVANAVPTGIVMDYRLLKTAGNPKVYLVQGNEKRLVPDENMFAFWNLDWDRLEIVTQAMLKEYVSKEELNYIRYGSFIGQASEKVKVYFISIDKDGNLAKRWIFNSAILDYLGGTPDDVHWLSNSEFNSIPEGVMYKPPELPSTIIVEPLKNCYDCHAEPMPVPIPSQPKLDLILLVDTTGSMGGSIENVKVSAGEIVNALDSEGIDYRVAVADYRDYPEWPYGSSEDYVYNLNLPFSRDKDAIINSINELNLGWGMDWRESVYSALVMSMTDTNKDLSKADNYGWRKGVSKAIIIMADAPPHDQEPWSEGHTFDEVIYWSENIDPVIVYSVVIGNDLTTYAAFSEISERTGGKVYSAPTASDVADAIIEAIEDINTGGINVEITPTQQETNPRDSVLYSVNTTNQGNIVDVYDISFGADNIVGSYRGYPLAIQYSWITFDNSTMKLDPSISEVRPLTIDIPKDWAGMEDVSYTFSVSAKSQTDEAVGNRSTAELIVRADKRSMIEYSKLEIQWFSELVESSTIDHGIKNALLKKLANAESKTDQALVNLDNGKPKTANNMLQASQNAMNAFVNLVEAQYDKKVMQPDAGILKKRAEQIMEDIEQTRNII